MPVPPVEGIGWDKLCSRHFFQRFNGNHPQSLQEFGTSIVDCSAGNFKQVSARGEPHPELLANLPHGPSNSEAGGVEDLSIRRLLGQRPDAKSLLRPRLSPFASFAVVRMPCSGFFFRLSHANLAL